jgi:glutamate racemase
MIKLYDDQTEKLMINDESRNEMMDLSEKSLPIGVMDSGVGGLTVVREITKLLPGEDVIYFGDSKRMPYGNRSEKEIVFLADKIIEFLEEKKVKAILLACNTVSSQIEKLIHKVPVFGIIEAGCIAAIESSDAANIGLIATVATVKSGVYDRTLRQMDSRRSFISNDSRKLPQVINDQLKHKYLLNKHIHECIDPILEKGDINELKLINPANKQVQMLKDYLEENDLLNPTKMRNIEIFTTARINEFKEALDRLNIVEYELNKVALLDEDYEK